MENERKKLLEILNKHIDMDEKNAEGIKGFIDLMTNIDNIVSSEFLYIMMIFLMADFCNRSEDPKTQLNAFIKYFENHINKFKKGQLEATEIFDKTWATNLIKESIEARTSTKIKYFKRDMNKFNTTGKDWF